MIWLILFALIAVYSAFYLKNIAKDIKSVAAKSGVETLAIALAGLASFLVYKTAILFIFKA